MKQNIKIILAIVATSTICTIGCVIAGAKYLASEISYVVSGNSSISTAEDALNDLYVSSNNKNYSTEEQVIGTWIDGKPLYRKTYKITTWTVGGTTSVAHNLENVNFVDIQGAAYFVYNNESFNRFYSLPAVLGDQDAYIIKASINDYDNAIEISAGKYMGLNSNSYIYVNLYYTKIPNMPE